MTATEPPAAVATQPAVDIRALRVELSGSRADVVDEVSLGIGAGETLALVGESGCGKTTVGQALLGHCRRGARIVAGEIRVYGADVAAMDARALTALRGRVVSYIPQNPPTALNPALRIGSQLREVLDTHTPDWSDEEREARLREVLEEVSLPSDRAFLRRFPHQLSGGQMQRVAIAMAFACRPKVLVCDEPTTGLDVTTQERVLQTIRELCSAHSVAALYVSHDLAVVASLADRVAVMYGGRVVETGTRDQLFGASSHPYTRRLMLAVPSFDGSHVPVGIPGYAPVPGERPDGCFFAPRCPLAIDRCREEFPPVTTVQEGHEVRCHRAADVAAAAAQGTRRTPAPPGELALEARDVVARYDGEPVLHDVSVAVRAHECLALVGESGSGKTTLARCIAGLHRDYTGATLLAGEVLPPAARQRTDAARREIQYIFQNPDASLNPRRTVGQSIAVPLRLFFDLDREATRRAVGEALERVSLSARMASRFPDQLSGGERQRVAIARALAARPSVLVCDEITSALDVSVQSAIVQLLGRLQAEMGLSMLFITHNLALVRTIADRVAVMNAGRIVEEGTSVAVLQTPRDDYTRKLLANTPTIELGAAARPAAAT